MIGEKDVENRQWRTKLRGRIWVHASSRPIRNTEWIVDELPTSAIIGSVVIIDCIEDSESEWAVPESWHWLLANPIEFEKPVPCAGSLNFWTPPPTVFRRCRRQLALAGRLTSS